VEKAEKISLGEFETTQSWSLRLGNPNKSSATFFCTFQSDLPTHLENRYQRCFLPHLHRQYTRPPSHLPVLFIPPSFFQKTFHLTSLAALSSYSLITICHRFLGGASCLAFFKLIPTFNLRSLQHNFTTWAIGRSFVVFGEIDLFSF
jgi:hypothetical protein